MLIFFVIVVKAVLITSDPIGHTQKPQSKNETILANLTRRILHGHEVGATRPYMVYLRPASGSNNQLSPGWLCGGVIINPRYVLTSAACIEDVKHFYVVSGTHRWVPYSVKDDECVKNGAKKAVWKCVPKSYVYDGSDFDNIRWMMNDIAIVKVEDDFNFNRRVRGCDFIPAMIDFNNKSEELEKPNSPASIAGWGTTDRYSDPLARTSANSPVLLETNVMIINKKNCKKRWEERYHYIIDDYMICGKDGTDSEAMSTICFENEVSCKELVYSNEYNEDEESKTRRMVVEPGQLLIHSANHPNHTRRGEVSSSGFCENDHGGPLVVGHGKSAIVVGIISACLTKDFNHKCYGPFLYTSVWKNRNVITCAMDKDIGATCRKLLRSTKTQIAETILNWSGHEDGPEAPSDKHSKNTKYRNKETTRKANDSDQ